MLDELRVAELLEALGAKTPAPASGSAVALTGAIAAALAELAARFAGDDDAIASARSLGARLTALADEDAAAYTAFMASRTDETRAWIVAVPLEIAACADEVAALADRMRLAVSASVAGDAEVAAELARAAAGLARRLAELNV